MIEFGLSHPLVRRTLSLVRCVSPWGRFVQLCVPTRLVTPNRPGLPPSSIGRLPSQSSFFPRALCVPRLLLVIRVLLFAVFEPVLPGCGTLRLKVCAWILSLGVKMSPAHLSDSSFFPTSNGPSAAMSTSARRRLMRDFKVCILEMFILKLFGFFHFRFGLALILRWASPVS